METIKIEGTYERYESCKTTRKASLKSSSEESWKSPFQLLFLFIWTNLKIITLFSTLFLRPIQFSSCWIILGTSPINYPSFASFIPLLMLTSMRCQKQLINVSFESFICDHNSGCFPLGSQVTNLCSEIALWSLPFMITVNSALVLVVLVLESNGRTVFKRHRAV